MTTAVLIDKIEIVLREAQSAEEMKKKIGKIIKDFDADLVHDWDEDNNILEYKALKTAPILRRGIAI